MMTLSMEAQLASSLGQRDEVPNIKLAEKIARQGSPEQVKELMSLLEHKKPGVRSDAIKVVYELTDRRPDLMVGKVKDFIRLLDHKDNRLRWGAMSALSAMSKFKPELLASHLVRIVDAMEEGTVITRDHGIYILSEVAGTKKHHAAAMELMLEQIEKAPVNQFPMYAEKFMEVISQPYVKRFKQILSARTDVKEIPSKAKRIQKVQRGLQERFPG
jgi:hypothetical protein